MQVENSIFLFHEADKQLFCMERGGKYGKLTPSIIEKEMQYSKNPVEMHIRGITQEGLEYFVDKYGATYQTLYLDDCTYITDLAPLESLPNLEAICIEHCKSIADLWQLSKNRHLRVLSIRDSKKLTSFPLQLNTSDTLEEVRFWGTSSEHKYHMKSLLFLSGMQSLRRLDLNNIILENHDTSVLATLPNMSEFHFDAGMLTTEEIALICVQFPQLYGQSLGAYTFDDIGIDGNVRICGYRKPTLTLPSDKDKLNMYVENFNKIKERLSESVLSGKNCF